MVNRSEQAVQMAAVSPAATKKASVAKASKKPHHVFPLPGFFPRYGQYVVDDDGEQVVERVQVEKEPTLPDNIEEIIAREPPVIYCSALLNLLDEGLVMLWGLSYVTDEFLSLMERRISDPVKQQHAEILKNNVSPEVYEALLVHVEILFNWERAVLSGEQETLLDAERQLSWSAWVLARLFAQHSDSAEIFASLKTKQSGSGKYFQKMFQKFRMLALKRLGTSLEEEEAIEDYRKEMYYREEKAMKEHQALELQLDAERKERARQYAQYKEAEKKIQQDKDTSNAQRMALEAQLKADCDSLAEREFKAFNAEETMLLAENTTMSTNLTKMQNDNRDRELSLRGKKGQSVEEVQALLEEYEQGILTRKAELDALCEEHRDMKAKINLYQGYFDEKARLAAVKAEEERLAWERICNKFVERKVPYHAARKIQRAWKKHKAYVARQKKKGGKGGKKKKKGGKTKGKAGGSKKKGAKKKKEGGAKKK
ncbi:hypothetical protein MPTK1_1g03790 [Marchantia polymorpha subsp. ruderalis]|uniref:Dynein regulatory complex protein 10 n=2 Tax=Marchantia polymorpha TaxID=3197 RepID=A0AAF6AL79_MARPO|nr:hypothetical protein MARPO_0005s0228 [Marchantia polymorpha]BBM97199.1 hypothetical protein Mp_1g03790 [Marchantia polymorpha subsp. ruderalis]|eukprot:PTQ48606.1 hypothetical protein MARPO_0005s0228 [Marchantia polymorpha]